MRIPNPLQHRARSRLSPATAVLSIVLGALAMGALGSSAAYAQEQAALVSVSSHGSGLAPFAHVEPRSDPTRDLADTIMRKDYKSFIVYRSTVHPAPFDWSADGCSWPATPHMQLLFVKPCVQHDFGYRNYGHGLKLGSNEDMRGWIDDRFLQEARQVCMDTFPGWVGLPQRTKCFTEAGTMWTALRHGGRDAFYNG